MVVKKIRLYLERQSLSAICLIGVVLTGIIGAIDYITGNEIGFSLFYLLPIALVSWYANRIFGLLAAIISALVWLGIDAVTGSGYSHPFFYIWNTLIRLSFFIIIALLLTAIKAMIERETRLARTDHLTDAVNRRYFYELLQMEINRLQRYHHAFTIAYMDLDNFKKINDTLGHPVGDQVLQLVVDIAKRNLRNMDVVARLGGDEFAIILPETNQSSASKALFKIREDISSAMQEKNWPTTLSIGAITCEAMPIAADKLIAMADDIMYAVKQEGKNDIYFTHYSNT